MDDYEHQFADYLIRYLSKVSSNAADMISYCHKDICNINQRLQSIIERSRKVRLILAKSNPPGTSGCSPNTNLFAKRHSCYDQGSDIYTSPLNVYHPVLSNLSLDKANLSKNYSSVYSSSKLESKCINQDFANCTLNSNTPIVYTNGNTNKMSIESACGYCVSPITYSKCTNYRADAVDGLVSVYDKFQSKSSTDEETPYSVLTLETSKLSFNISKISTPSIINEDSNESHDVNESVQFDELPPPPDSMIDFASDDETFDKQEKKEALPTNDKKFKDDLLEQIRNKAFNLRKVSMLEKASNDSLQDTSKPVSLHTALNHALKMRRDRIHLDSDDQTSSRSSQSDSNDAIWN